MMGELISPSIELTVIQAKVVVGECDGIWGSLNLGFEELVDTAMFGRASFRASPLHEQLVPVVVGQKWQFRQMTIGVHCDSRQKRAKVP